jgi:flagellar assembly factor FliW
MTEGIGEEPRVILTSQFGEITIEKQNIFNFSEGLFGFEDLKEFIVISEEETAPFKWLLSIDNPDIGFPLLSPWFIDSTYSPGIKIDPNVDIIMAIVTLENEKGLMSANFKAPIIFNTGNQTGRQVILPSDKFSTNHTISNGNKSTKSVVF